MFFVFILLIVFFWNFFQVVYSFFIFSFSVVAAIDIHVGHVRLLLIEATVQLWDTIIARLSGAHNPERATSMRSCHGVFTDQFIFRTVFSANFEYLLNFTNQLAKPTDLCFLFLISYTSNALIVMVEILFSREKVP